MDKKYKRLAGPAEVSLGGVATAKDVAFTVDEKHITKQIMAEFDVVEVNAKKSSKKGV